MSGAYRLVKTYDRFTLSYWQIPVKGQRNCFFVTIYAFETEMMAMIYSFF